MGFLLFTTIMLSIVVVVLAIEMSSLENRLSDYKANTEYYRSKSDHYWNRLVERGDEIRKLNQSFGVYYEANKDLQNQLADALHEAESFRELAKERSEEIEKQDERIHILKRELENEFDWSMRYSESVDRYATWLYESQEEVKKLEGELEQTQETLNMLEHGYQLLKEENSELEDEIEALQQYIMESEYGDDL